MDKCRCRGHRPHCLLRDRLLSLGPAGPYIRIRLGLCVRGPGQQSGHYLRLPAIMQARPHQGLPLHFQQDSSRFHPRNTASELRLPTSCRLQEAGDIARTLHRRNDDVTAYDDCDPGSCSPRAATTARLPRKYVTRQQVRVSPLPVSVSGSARPAVWNQHYQGRVVVCWKDERPPAAEER